MSRLREAVEALRFEAEAAKKAVRHTGPVMIPKAKLLALLEALSAEASEHPKSESDESRRLVWEGNEARCERVVSLSLHVYPGAVANWCWVAFPTASEEDTTMAGDIAPTEAEAKEAAEAWPRENYPTPQEPGAVEEK